MRTDQKVGKDAFAPTAAPAILSPSAPCQSCSLLWQRPVLHAQLCEELLRAPFLCKASYYFSPDGLTGDEAALRPRRADGSSGAFGKLRMCQKHVE